jgi:hypothetical protein
MDNQNFLVFAGDGDNIGQRHARTILSDDINAVREVSEHITAGNDYVRQFVEQHGGQWISGGGDEFTFEAPAEFIELLEQIRKDYQYMVQATLSIGYGQTISQAGKALLVAKERGKDQVIQYDESVEQEVQNIQEFAPSDEDQEKKKIKGVLGQEVGKEESEEEVGEVGLKQSNVEQQSDENNNCEGQPHQESQGGYANEVSSDGITRADPPKYDNNHQYDSGYKNSSKEARGQSYREEDLAPPIIAKPNLTPKSPVAEATSGDVPESSRPMNNEPANPGEQPPEDKKPVYKYYDGQAEWIKPDQDENGAPQSMSDATNENRPSDLKYMRHGKEEPQADMAQEDSTTNMAEDNMAQDMGTEGTQEPTPIEEIGHCPGCRCDEHGSADKPMEEVLDQHIDNAKDFTNTIGEGGDQGNDGSADPGESIEDILDQHLDNAADMENQGEGDVNSEGMDPNGISRPEDYDAKQGDLGLSEEDNEEPQLDEVLRDGLDSHADGIQREKVVNMVGEALDAFKAQKQILDKAKSQAPELYDACLMMLRSMIELCGLAGIDQSQPEQEVNEIEGQGENPEEMPGAESAPKEEPGVKESCPNCGHQKEKPAVPKEEPQNPPQL